MKTIIEKLDGMEAIYIIGGFCVITVLIIVVENLINKYQKKKGIKKTVSKTRQLHGDNLRRIKK